MKKIFLILSFILLNLIIFLSSFADNLSTILAISTTDINSGGYSDKIKLILGSTNYNDKLHYQGIRVSFVNKNTREKIGKNIDITRKAFYDKWINGKDLYYTDFKTKLDYQRKGLEDFK